MSSHYSSVQCAEVLSRRASAWAARTISNCLNKKGLKQNRFPILIYQGMSGVGSATAVALSLNALSPHFKFGMIYVRKDKEQSHGIPAEHNLDDWDGSMTRSLIFVDDFVCTGVTYARAMYAALNFLNLSTNRFDTGKHEIIQMNYDPSPLAAIHDELSAAFKTYISGG